MVWAFDDVNDLILDVFGFLFMQSLDDYSGIIDYGIEQTDFTRIIQERSLEVDTKVRWDLEEGRDVRQAEFDSVMPKAHWLKTRICTRRHILHIRPHRQCFGIVLWLPHLPCSQVGG